MKMMYGMLMALTPAALFAIYSYRLKALLLIITGVASAVLAEAIYQKLTGQKITVKDGSAAVTGLLLALAVSISTPLYALGISAAVGIIVGKQLFGGFGKNIFNPAIFGRLFLSFCISRFYFTLERTCRYGYYIYSTGNNERDWRIYTNS